MFANIQLVFWVSRKGHTTLIQGTSNSRSVQMFALHLRVFTWYSANMCGIASSRTVWSKEFPINTLWISHQHFIAVAGAKISAFDFNYKFRQVAELCCGQIYTLGNFGWQFFHTTSNICRANVKATITPTTLKKQNFMNQCASYYFGLVWIFSNISPLFGFVCAISIDMKFLRYFHVIYRLRAK